MEKETLDKVSAFIAENKGSRKFTQSVELAINFTGIDMSKQANRLNMEVKLPNGKGKAQKVMVFADDKNMVAKATAAGAQIVSGAGDAVDGERQGEAQLPAQLRDARAAEPHAADREELSDSSSGRGTRCRSR